jgi:hypothetical protein
VKTGALRCYSLLLGARNTGARGGRFRPGDDRRLREITARHFPRGFTILAAEGGWFDAAAGRFIEEESRQILISTGRPAALRAWCQELGRAFGQQELVLVELGPARAFRIRPR